jgi:hypothetical protein
MWHRRDCEQAGASMAFLDTSGVCKIHLSEPNVDLGTPTISTLDQVAHAPYAVSSDRGRAKAD